MGPAHWPLTLENILWGHMTRGCPSLQVRGTGTRNEGRAASAAPLGPTGPAGGTNSPPSSPNALLRKVGAVETSMPMKDARNLCISLSPQPVCSLSPQRSCQILPQLQVHTHSHPGQHAISLTHAHPTNASAMRGGSVQRCGAHNAWNRSGCPFVTSNLKDYDGLSMSL